MKDLNNTYNGWHNYETWLVSLWIDNDSGEQSYYYMSIKDLDYDIYEVSQYIKDELENIVPDEANLMVDLLRSALSEVNFREIAEHLIAGCKEEEEYERELEAECYKMTG